MQSICNNDITFTRAQTHEIVVSGVPTFSKKSAYNRGPRSIEAHIIEVWLSHFHAHCFGLDVQ
jgi:hypothetical protein